MENITLGYALTGSFCTLRESIETLRILSRNNINIVPIVSEAVFSTDTRFGKAKDIVAEIEEICNKKVINSIVSAEPIGPKNLLDILVVAPATGNTLAKHALGITDSTVTMAIKAHLRNNKPVVFGIATNDALGGSGKNIGLLHNTKNIYFVPYSQDDPHSKTKSLICDFSLIPQTIEKALKGEQLQPIFV